MAGRRIVSLAAGVALLSGACGSGGDGGEHAPALEVAERTPIETWKAQPEVSGVNATTTLRKFEYGDTGSGLIFEERKTDSRLTAYSYEVTANISSATPPTGCVVLYLAGLAKGSELDPTSTPVEGYTLQLGPVCNDELAYKSINGSFSVKEGNLNVPGQGYDADGNFIELPASPAEQPPNPPSKFVIKMCIFNADTPANASAADQCNTAYFA